MYIYKVDRLGRSLKHLLDRVTDLQRREVGWVSLTDTMNTHSAQGRVGGRKPVLSEKAPHTALAAETLYRAQQLSTHDRARSLRIAKATFYKYLRHRGAPIYPHCKRHEQKTHTDI